MRHRLEASLREVEEVRLVEARLRETAARAELAALQAQMSRVTQVSSGRQQAVAVQFEPAP